MCGRGDYSSNWHYRAVGFSVNQMNGVYSPYSKLGGVGGGKKKGKGGERRGKNFPPKSTKICTRKGFWG